MNATVDPRRSALAHEIAIHRVREAVPDKVWAQAEWVNGKLDPPYDDLMLRTIFDEEVRRPLDEVRCLVECPADEDSLDEDSQDPRTATAVSEPLDPKALGWIALVYQGAALRKQGATYTRVHEALSDLNQQRAKPYSEDVIAKLAVSAMGPKVYPNTEAGDAEFFAALHAENVRYDHGRGRWLELKAETGIWVPDGVERLHVLALAMMRRRQRNAVVFVTDPEEKKKAANWAFNGESVRRLDNTLRLARTMPPIADAGDGWDPDPYLIGAPNGVIDLQTGQVRKGRPEDRVTMRVAVPYDPTAACPLWEETVSAIFDGDASLIGFVHRASGYSITGDCREECLFLMYGLGGNGKGTFINTTARVIGEYSDDVPFSTLERSERASIPADVANSWVRDWLPPQSLEAGAS